jgi:hypothetical protein
MPEVHKEGMRILFPILTKAPAYSLLPIFIEGLIYFLILFQSG